MVFYNGERSWMETFYEATKEIEFQTRMGNKTLLQIRDTQGHGGLYDLAEYLTDGFEKLHQGREWDGEWLEEIWKYFEKELNSEGTWDPFNGLNAMAHKVYDNNKEKGFWDSPRNVGETLMLVVTELGEALEAHRKGSRALPPINKVTTEQFKQLYKDTFEDEMADALIRILDYCGGMGIDIEWHVREKVKYNETREKLHGKNY